MTATGGGTGNSAETAVSFVWKAQERCCEAGTRRSTVEYYCYCYDGNLEVHAGPWAAEGSVHVAAVAWAAVDSEVAAAAAAAVFVNVVTAAKNAAVIVLWCFVKDCGVAEKSVCAGAGFVQVTWVH